MQSHRGHEILQAFRTECDLDGFMGSLMEQTYQQGILNLGKHYAANQPEFHADQPKKSIPKILHQIWIGPHPIPARYQEFMQGWRQQYPDWEYRLWTDREVEGLELETAEIVNQSTCMGLKTDLIRVEILKRFGGLYVDCDYECLKPLGNLHEMYDFYGTLRALPLLYLGSPKTYPGPFLICNSMIGSRPGHPILQAYLNRVKVLHRQPDLFELQWNQRYSLARLRFSLAQIKRIKETTLKTYIPFHEIVLEHLASPSERNIVFPPLYFNPIDKWYNYRFVFWRFWVKRLQYMIKQKTFSVKTYQQTLPKTFTIHHSQASWLQA